MVADVPRSRVRGATRERILEAALELFVERGFDGTSVSAIERAVGLAAGTGSFYRHFASKAAVLVASIEVGVTQLVEMAAADRATLDDVTDPPERKRREYTLRLRHIERFGPLWNLVATERGRFPELRDIFVSGLGMTEWDAGWADARPSAIAFAALAGYSQLALLGDGPFHNVAPEDFVDALVEYTIRLDALDALDTLDTLDTLPAPSAG